MGVKSCKAHAHHRGHAREKRVAVGGASCRVRSADEARRAGLVVDDHRLSQRFAQPVTQQSGQRVDGHAGTERHHHPDRLGRPFVLRECKLGRRARGGGEQSEPSAIDLEHAFSPVAGEIAFTNTVR
jgi:hypothetical protein